MVALFRHFVFYLLDELLATSICFNERSIYTEDVLVIVLKQLVQINPIPILFMRTVLQTLALHPKMIDFIMNILQQLIEKQVNSFVKTTE